LKTCPTSYSTPTIFKQTGTGTSICLPVGDNFPVLASLLKIVILSVSKLYITLQTTQTIYQKKLTHKITREFNKKTYYL